MSIYKDSRAQLVRTPRSRSTDGYGSTDAEARINRNGTAASQQRTVLRAFVRHPGATTKEIAQLEGLDRVMVARRTPELAEIYLHRIEPPPGTPRDQRELRWMPTELGKRVVEKMKP
jgi:DNA-binding MarR family transcriptional regulator